MADNSIIAPGIKDENAVAFNELIERLGQLDLTVLLIYLIDSVKSCALPFLAEQFHVCGDEGWILAQNEEEKRELIKNAILLHRYKGTKYAIKSVLKKLNLDGNVTEWFEYAGDPYYFRVAINLLTRGLDEATFNRLEALIYEYKNERSWLDRLDVYLTNISPIYYGLAGLVGEKGTIYPWNITYVNQNAFVYYGLGFQAVEKVSIYPL